MDIDQHAAPPFPQLLPEFQRLFRRLDASNM